MIEVGRFESCVCIRRKYPNNLCDGNLAFEEKGKKVQIVPRRNEEAKAIAIDQCVCCDDLPKCDGLFIFRKENHHYMILIELKGGDLIHAFEQLAYMRHHRIEYQELTELIQSNGNNGNIKHEAFIVSNFILSTVEHQKLEKANKIRVKKILYSEATKQVPDVRKYLG